MHDAGHLTLAGDSDLQSAPEQGCGFTGAAMNDGDDALGAIIDEGALPRPRCERQDEFLLVSRRRLL